MSYCRIDEDGSDVYLFSTGTRLELYAARRDMSFPLDADGRTRCRDYLLVLRDVDKLQVPQKAIDRLTAEISELPFKTDVEKALDEELGLTNDT